MIDIRLWSDGEEKSASTNAAWVAKVGKSTDEGCCRSCPESHRVQFATYRVDDLVVIVVV